MVFQICAKTDTHCASYMVVVNADRIDELENGRQVTFLQSTFVVNVFISNTELWSDNRMPKVYLYL